MAVNPNCKLSKNELIDINNGEMKPEDIINKKLACNKSVHINATAQQDFIKDRMRTKEVKNLDEVFQKLNKLRANGVLDIYVKKFGPIGHSKGPLKESYIPAGAINKIETLLENMGAPVVVGTVASSTGAPIASYGGTPDTNQVRDKYAKPVLSKTTQDIGSEERTK